jgi:hypothetical protein
MHVSSSRYIHVELQAKFQHINALKGIKKRIFLLINTKQTFASIIYRVTTRLSTVPVFFSQVVHML